jgi:hypothetical protein
MSAVRTPVLAKPIASGDTSIRMLLYEKNDAS